MLVCLNNRYQVIRSLSEGGFGKTFLAQDTYVPSNRLCVVKQLKPIVRDPQAWDLAQRLFRREAKTLEHLGDSHPFIPRLYAYFAEAGQFYLVQEWIEGQTLTQHIQTKGLFDEDSVKEMLVSILQTLTYVHTRCIHRDIKPDNIILRATDGLPVLIDFGAVKEKVRTISNLQSQLFQLGTPGFMSPEQAAGQTIVSSDLYSLGFTAIYLLTGKLPQELPVDPQTGEILWKQYAPDVSQRLAGILNRATQRHLPYRYKMAREMLDVLKLHSNSITPKNSSPQSAFTLPSISTLKTQAAHIIRATRHVQLSVSRQTLRIAIASTIVFAMLGTGLWIVLAILKQNVPVASSSSSTPERSPTPELNPTPERSPTPLESPIQSSAASTPTPSFTSSPTAEAPSTSTDKTPDSRVKDEEPIDSVSVPVIGQTYREKSGLFELSLPEGYTYQEMEDGITFTSGDGGFGGYVGFRSLQGEPFTNNQELEASLKSTYEEWLEQVAWQGSEIQPDGSLRIDWFGRDRDGEDLDGVSFIEQRGDYVFVLTLFGINHFYQDYVSDAEAIVATYRVHSE